MKRIALIIVLSLLFVVAIATGLDKQNKSRFECINQDDKLVINTYSDETLRVSQSFQDDRMVVWRQGFKSPHTEKITDIAFDISPLSLEGRSLLRVYAGQTDGKYRIIFWNIVSEECYDVIYATRFKRAVFF